MSPEERFERIEALLHGMAERGNQMEARSIENFERAMAHMREADVRMDKAMARMHETDVRMDKAMAHMHKADVRMDKAMARLDKADARADRADARMDKFDKKLDATRKLVEAGIKLVSRFHAEGIETRREVRETNRMLKAMLRLNGNGRNGKKHG